MTLQKKTKKYSPTEKYFVAPVFCFFEKEKPVKEKKNSNFHLFISVQEKRQKTHHPKSFCSTWFSERFHCPPLSRHCIFFYATKKKETP
jgi:hypothetical protein